MEKIPSKKTNEPIIETDKSVSYLGVNLLKAKNREGAVGPEKYKFYINDKFRLELQRDIATAWALNEPYLFIGGTSIGKTTTVNKMCAELGYEMHYYNCTGNTEEMDLLGRYIPNVHKKTPEDPEYIFQPGPVTRALMQESDKVKVLFLDEINVSQPKVLSLLHDVMDSLKTNTEYTLNVKDGEKIPTDREKTKIIAAANPVSGDMTHASPLSLATIRRFTMQRVPDTLPDEALKNTIFSKCGFGSIHAIPAPESSYRYSNQKILDSRQLSRIPGMSFILDKYFEFHKHASLLLDNGQIGEDDRVQPFKFDANEDVDRVIRFVKRFYNGDINTVMQDAIKYIYLNRLSNPKDHTKLLEKAREIYYEPPKGQRKGLDDPLDLENILSLHEIETLLPDNFYGPRVVEKMLKTRLKKEDIPPIHLTMEEVLKIKETNGSLILKYNFDAEGKPLTIKNMEELDLINFAPGVSRFLKRDPFYTDDTELKKKATWQIVWDVPESAGLDITKQFEVTGHLYDKNTEEIINSSGDEERITELKDIHKNQERSGIFETAQEVLYRMALFNKKNAPKVLYPDVFVTTQNRNGLGKPVNVGHGDNGIVVNGFDENTGSPKRISTVVWELPPNS